MHQNIGNKLGSKNYQPMNRIKNGYLTIIQIIRRLFQGKTKASYNVNKDYVTKGLPNSIESNRLGKNSLSGQEDLTREFSADNEGQKSMLIQAQEILKPKMTSKEIIDYQFKILAWLRFSLESP